jgi:hypothetical protein
MNEDQHRTDGDLIGLLDGDRDLDHREIEGHVDSCAACSARLALLQHRSARFSELLRVIDAPVVERSRLTQRARVNERRDRHTARRHLWLHPAVRAAAAILLLAGVAAASPARRWIFDRIAGHHTDPGPREGIDGTRSPAPIPEQSEGPIVRFATESSELVIVLAVRPAAGTLVIVAGEENRSSAQVVAGSHGEAFLVLPSELRIRNASRSVADYRVTVSPIVRQVRVQMADGDRREVTAIDVSPGMRHVVRLGPREDNR